MSDLIDRRAVLYVNAIRRTLMEHWDPMGFRGIPELEGEYDAYLAPLHSMLAGRRPTIELGQYLRAVELGQLKLGETTAASESAAEQLARIPSEVDVAMGQPEGPKQLSVEAVNEPGAASFVPLDDDYLALSFLLDPDPGAGCSVYLGKDLKQRLQLRLTARMSLRGLTLVWMDTPSRRALPGEGSVRSGVPVLRLAGNSASAGCDGGARSVDQGFTAFVLNGALELQLEGATHFDGLIRHDIFDFLTCGEVLAGIRIRGLPKAAWDKLADDVRRQGMQLH